MRNPRIARLLCLAVLLSSGAAEFVAQAQAGAQKSNKKQVALRIRAWTVDETLGDKTEQSMDTTTLNFQNNCLPERNTSIAGSYLANQGSPYLSMVYTEREAHEAFWFMQPYDHWKKSNAQWQFLNTTKPYTNGYYTTTIADNRSGEENFRFYYSGNVTPRLNIGGDYEALNARGYYTNLASRHKSAHAFANYQSPRYDAFFRYSHHTLNNYENGGITDDRYITDPLGMSGGYREYESLNIPIRLNNTFNHLKYNDVFLTHRYHLGYEKEVANEGDTSLMFVPVSSIIHTFEWNQGRKNYDSRTVNSGFYDHAYLSPSLTADTAALMCLRNVVGLSLNEGFKRWMKFGLTAYAEHEWRRYACPTGELPDSTEFDPTRRMGRYNEQRLWVGGRIASSHDSIYQFHADAKFCLIGPIGNYRVDGGVKVRFKLWKHPCFVGAEVKASNEIPDYFLRHYVSNHYVWDNDFNSEFRTRLSGLLEAPDWGFHLRAGVENLNRYVYLDENALPTQESGPVQVLFAQWNQHIGIRWFNLDFDAVGQLSSRPDVLPLPALAVYGNLYAKFMISKVMTTQIGVDCRFFTAYYLPAYDPALGHYHNQTETKVGNYPFMNVYANFQLKRARFFVMYEHLSRLFASPNYFTTLHYPQNPASFRAGLSWNFYD